MAQISQLPIAPRFSAPRLELVAYLHGRKHRFSVPESGSICVGRSVSCEVRLNHNSVSRRHLLLRAEEGTLLAEDQGSRNGTRFFSRDSDAEHNARAEDTHSSSREWLLPPHTPQPVGLGDVLRVGSVMIRVEEQRSQSQEQLEEEHAVFRDPKTREVFSLAERVAQSDISVLVLGETGVGKDVLAHAIHRASKRKHRPFVRIHCAALAENLLESELFGHVKGAFTGAVGNEGLIESANGGTVFLDELGEMPLSTQVKLLNVLETGEVLRVGSTRPKKVDVRFIAATNRHLPRSIAEGTFRNDLYFRVAGITLELPPLRKRRADIEALAFHFAEKAAERAGLPNPPEISRSCLARLESWHYPGNVRELKNIIDRAVLLCSGNTIEETDLIIEPATFYQPPHSSQMTHATHPGISPADAATTSWTPYMRPQVAPPSFDDDYPVASGPASRSRAAGYLPEPGENDWEATEIRRTKPSHLGSFNQTAASSGAMTADSWDGDDSQGDKRQRIEQALLQCGGNQTRAALQLGISRRTLINWMDDLKLPRPRKGG